MEIFLIGLLIGGIIATLVYQFLPSRQASEQKKKIVQLTNEKIKLRNENFNLKSENTRHNSQEERITSLEGRMDQAEEWFGSVIRHSREQFSKESVEKFIEEHGMKDE